MTVINNIGLQKLKEDKTKLLELKRKLQAAEDSPLVENFSSKLFIKKLHEKYLKQY